MLTSVHGSKRGGSRMVSGNLLAIFQDAKNHHVILQVPRSMHLSSRHRNHNLTYLHSIWIQIMVQ